MQTLALTDVLAIDDQHRGKEPALAVPALVMMSQFSAMPTLYSESSTTSPQHQHQQWPKNHALPSIEPVRPMSP